MQRFNQDDHKSTGKVWENEAEILQQMNSLNGTDVQIVRFFTAFRLGDPEASESPKHYLMFELATGNLRQLWKNVSRPILTRKLVRDTVDQLQGLADALQAAHDPAIGQRRFRHGDLKPENILWFKDSKSGIGVLKIADWGLAKQHTILTELRNSSTTTPTGTRLYEPPEEVTGEFVNRDTLHPGKTIKRRSRLCDIWAMGCITLEFLIWLMYGFRGLTEFARSLGVFEEGNYARFFQIFEKEGKRTARVHEVVICWMDHIADDPACKGEETALGDLLDMVRTRLLVVKLPQRLATRLFEEGDNASITRTSSDQQLGDQHTTGRNSDENSTANSAAGNGGPDYQLVVDLAPNQPPSSTRAPLEIKPLTRSTQRGMERALASGFADHLQIISGSEHKMSGDEQKDRYWLTRQPGSPPCAGPQSDTGHGTGESVQQTRSRLSTDWGTDVTRYLVTGLKRVCGLFSSKACSQLCGFLLIL